MPARPGGPLPWRLPHRDRLGLILRGVADRQMQHAMGAAPVGQQGIARRPRRRLQAVLRLLATPSQDMRRTAWNCSKNLRDVRALGGRFRAQAVIDGEDDQAARPAPRTHSASSNPRPRESDPPDTATAIDGGRSNGPSGAINAAMSISGMGAARQGRAAQAQL